MIQKNIDDIAQRFDAFVAALTTAMPTRTVKEEVLPYTEHEPQQLRDGVLTVLSSDERDYSNSQGMKAREGTHRLILVGHLQLDEAATAAEIRNAEFALIEEVKTFVRAGIPGMSLSLVRSVHSRGLEKPYGWTLQYIDAGPLNHNVS